MKAATLKKYNKHNLNLLIQEVSIPRIQTNQLLIKVSAAGVNPLDNLISRGEVKLVVPYALPQIAGNEVVGLVTEIGKQVTNFQVGDRVFARLPLKQIGAFAEYLAVDSSAVAKVPAYLTDNEAAAIPLTSLTLMQALDLMQAKPGQTLFISGGTGGLGATAIPLAKAKGLTVITSGNASGKERVLALGAEQFIDYQSEDYTQILSQVDFVLDTLGGNETEKQMSIMKKGGKMVSLRGLPNGAFAKRMNLPKWKQLLFGLAGHKTDQLAKQYGVTYDFLFVEANGRQLQEVAEIFTRLKLKPSVDAVYKFADINQAMEKVATGHSRGKTVIKFDAEID